MEKHEIIQALLLQMRKLRMMESKIVRMMSSHDDKIPIHHLMMLLHLTESGPIPIRKIKDEFRVSASAATQLIDSLEKEHFIHKTRDEHDRRSIKIHLSDLGREKIHNYYRELEKYMEQLVDYVGLDDMMMSLRINEKINEFNNMMEEDYGKDKTKK
ncbi:MAG: MarR family transcriptional regulator [Erysipelotrichia bacterium]|jgi:DNA-binding MarR family transcriptional regulator|nr:MarR family transcriptional regulator [Erysipelotrichia bacterium]